MADLAKERAERLKLFRSSLSTKENKDLKLDKTKIKADGAEASDMRFISTGSVVINRVCGGNGNESGFPRGRVIEIYGPESVGKTTLAVSACREAQKIGGIATYVDFEHALHLGYASEGIGLSLDEDKFQMFQPDYFEQGAAIIHNAATVLKSDVIVVDSVSSMLPKRVLEGEVSADPGMYMGLLARLMSQFLNVITKVIDESETCLIFVNQVRARIKKDKFDHGPDEDTSGGKALKFYASVRLQLKPGAAEFANIVSPMTGKPEKTTISNFVRAIAVKNKVSMPKRLGEVCMRYGEGIDNVRSILDVAVAHDIIKKEGSWFAYTGTTDDLSFRRQGQEAIRKYMIENPNSFKDIAVKVSDVLVKYTVEKVTDIDDSEIQREDLAEEYDKAVADKSKKLSKVSNEEVDAVDDTSAVDLITAIQEEKVPAPSLDLKPSKKKQNNTKVLSDDELDSVGGTI